MKYVLKFIGLTLLFPIVFSILLADAIWDWEFKDLSYLIKGYKLKFKRLKENLKISGK